MTQRFPTLNGVRRPSLLALGSYAALCVPLLLLFMVYPLAGGDYFHNTWTYVTNLRNAQDLRWFTATNIYFPLQGTGVMHELQPTNTLVFLPFYIAGHLLQGYFFVLFVVAVLTGFAVYWVARLLEVRHSVAFVVGLIVAFSGYSYHHLMHVQLLAVCWVLLPFACLLSYRLYGGSRWLLLFLLLMLPLAAGPSYTGVAAFLLVGTYLGLLLLFGRRAELGFVARIGAGLVAVVVICLPFNIAYLRALHNGMQRGIGEIGILASDVMQFLMPPPTSLLYGQLTQRSLPFEAFHSSWLFPGYSVLLFIGLGLAVALWRGDVWPKPSVEGEGGKVGLSSSPSWGRRGGDRAIVLLTMLFCGLLMLIFSLGPAVKIAGRPVIGNPIFTLFYDVVPLLKATRFVPQHGYIALVLMVILAAAVLGRDAVPAGNAVPSGRRLPVWAVAFAALFALVENCNLSAVTPQLMAAQDSWNRRTPPVYRELAKALPAPLVSIPAGGTSEYYYMYYSLFHRSPVFNGQTGFTPLLQQIGRKTLNDFPSAAAVDFARSIGLETIVVDKLALPQWKGGCRDVLRTSDAGSNLWLSYEDPSHCAIALRRPLNGYRVGDAVRFGTEGNFWRYLPQLGVKPVLGGESSGWSAGTDKATWTLGSVSELHLSVDRPSSSAQLKLWMKLASIFLPSPATRLIVKVELADVVLGVLELRSDHYTLTPEFVLPSDYFDRHGTQLRLRLRIEGAVSPASMGGSADNRLLGLLIESLGIAPVSP